MKAYKLTDKDDRTYGGCQWGKNVTHKANGRGVLCTEGWIHYYGDPVLALFLDPLHGDFGSTAHLWEVEVSGKVETDCGLKFGTTELTTLKRLRKKKITRKHRVRFAILCAKEVYHDKAWNEWADAWLDGTDRTHAAANNAAHAAAVNAVAVNIVAVNIVAVNIVAYNAAHAAAANTVVAYNAAYAVANTVAYIDFIAIARRAIKGGYK